MTATTFIGVSVRFAIANASGLHSPMLVTLCAKGIRNRCLEVICSDAQHVDFGATKKIIDRRIYLFQAVTLQMRFQVEHGTRWRHEEITANQDPLQNAT